MRLATIFAAVIVAAGTHTMAVATSQATPAPEAKDSTSVAGTLPVDGEVRKVDIDAKKITLKHGPIANLGMPAMRHGISRKRCCVPGESESGRQSEILR